MTSHKPLLAEISNINIFHITQYFWVKSYKRNQWNLPNILAYISGIFDDFFQSWVSPFKTLGDFYYDTHVQITILNAKYVSVKSNDDGIMSAADAWHFTGFFSRANRHHRADFVCSNDELPAYRNNSYDRMVGVIGGQSSAVSIQVSPNPVPSPYR